MDKYVFNGMLSDSVLGIVYVQYNNGFLSIKDGCYELDNLDLNINEGKE